MVCTDGDPAIVGRAFLGSWKREERLAATGGLGGLSDSKAAFEGLVWPDKLSIRLDVA